MLYLFFSLFVCFANVLFSAGMELVFSLVASAVQCFGFRMIIMLRKHWYFSWCWTVLTLSQRLFRLFSFPCFPTEQVLKKQLTQNGQRDIPHERTSCPVYKLGGVVQERSITAQQSVHSVPAQSGGGEHWYSASFISLGFYSSVSYVYLPCCSYCDYYYYIIIIF